MSLPIRSPWSRPQAEALKNRPDIKAQAEREAAARLNANAVKFERLPNLVAYADYGTTGINGDIVSLLPTRDYGFALRVPIFDGGRRDARRAETASQFRQERVRTNDLREQIELEIRTSLDSLHSAEEQLKVAEEGIDAVGQRADAGPPPLRRRLRQQPRSHRRADPPGTRPR